MAVSHLASLSWGGVDCTKEHLAQQRYQHICLGQQDMVSLAAQGSGAILPGGTRWTESKFIINFPTVWNSLTFDSILLMDTCSRNKA